MKDNSAIEVGLSREIGLLNESVDKAIEYISENKHQIHPTISYIDAISISRMGIDIAQFEPPNDDTYKRCREHGWFNKLINPMCLKCNQ